MVVDSDDNDPIMNALDNTPFDIDNAPSYLMTSEELAEEGLDALGVNLVDELGLDEDKDKDEANSPLSPSISVPPGTAQSAGPSAQPSSSIPAARPNPKEWFVHADDLFNL